MDGVRLRPMGCDRGVFAFGEDRFGEMTATGIR